jgi:hypothetical protein
MLYLQVFMAGKIRMRQRRRDAQVVLEVLKGWSVAGNLLVAAHTYYRHVKVIQRAWREYLVASHERRAQATALWLRLERATVAAGIRAEDRAKLARSKRNSKRKPEAPPAVTLTVAERVELALVPAALRESFLTAALAQKRRNLIPRLDQHERDMKAWRKALVEWRETKVAMATVSSSVEAAMPTLPGLPPSLRLEAAEVGAFIARARAPNSDSPASKAVYVSGSGISPSPVRSSSPARSPNAPRRRRRPRRAGTIQDVFSESHRQVVEELFNTDATSPGSSDCPPAEDDPKLRLLG